MVTGGWALGTVFMAADPVSSPFTDKGKWTYGIFIGILVVLIRCVNPAYPHRGYDARNLVHERVCTSCRTASLFKPMLIIVWLKTQRQTILSVSEVLFWDGLQYPFTNKRRIFVWHKEVMDTSWDSLLLSVVVCSVFVSGTAVTRINRVPICIEPSKRLVISVSGFRLLDLMDSWLSPKMLTPYFKEEGAPDRVELQICESQTGQVPTEPTEDREKLKQGQMLKNLMPRKISPKISCLPKYRPVLPCARTTL